MSDPSPAKPAYSRGHSLTPAEALAGPFPDADDLPPKTTLKRILGALPMLALYGGLTTWAYFAWYHNQPRNRKLTVNDWIDEGFGPSTYAGGADKTGHLYANYVFARLGAQFLMDRGWPAHWAVLTNVSFTLAFYTMVELRDGLHPGYGFSGPDYLANVLGCGLAALLLLVPSLDRLFDVRMRYRPSKLFVHAFLYERDIDVSEDYSGQTVILAFHFSGIPGLRKSPYVGFLRYLDLLIGYNARGFLPKPDPSVLREQELFVGLSLNLAEILRDLYPHGQRMGWLAKGLADLSEYVQITPLYKMANPVWRTPQPKGVIARP